MLPYVLLAVFAALTFAAFVLDWVRWRGTMRAWREADARFWAAIDAWRAAERAADEGRRRP